MTTVQLFGPQDPVWVVERYMPCASPARLAALVAATRAAGRHATAVTYLGSVAVPADEMCFCAFAAPSREAVEALVERVGVPWLRIVDAVAATA
jgi:Nickel responsive protein SCO4226-like